MHAIGLMSGTSLDGVDAVLMKPFEKEVVGRSYKPYSQGLKKMCLDIMGQDRVSLEQLANLSHELAMVYAQVTSTLMEKHANITPDVIGCHGQAISHRPDAPIPYTVQLVCPYTLAKLTKLPVTYDFRQADLVYGGQGAPLAPLYHQELFNLDEHTAVINLGGIANISYIDNQGNCRGFDSGPANSLLDAWIGLHQDKPFDNNGEWALSGECQKDLLSQLLGDPYFKKGLPKSLDKSYFSLDWLQVKTSQCEYRPEDVQRTLLEFTVKASSQAIKAVSPNCQRIILCGGGANNLAFADGFTKQFTVVETSTAYGFDPCDIEAMMMAWLAAKRIKNQRADLRSITGSSDTVILGAVVLP